MSVVLPFPQNRNSNGVQSTASKSAEIIIFPGVRVERRNFDLAATCAPARKHRSSQVAVDEDSLSLT
jgi:hypothetical protein